MFDGLTHALSDFRQSHSIETNCFVFVFFFFFSNKFSISFGFENTFYIYMFPIVYFII